MAYSLSQVWPVKVVPLRLSFHCPTGKYMSLVVVPWSSIGATRMESPNMNSESITRLFSSSGSSHHRGRMMGVPGKEQHLQRGPVKSNTFVQRFTKGTGNRGANSNDSMYNYPQLNENEMSIRVTTLYTETVLI